MDLLTLRKEIDLLDGELLSLLQRRQTAATQIAAYKAANGLPVTDAAREQEILQRAEEAGGAYAKTVFRAVLDASREVQNAYLNNAEK